MSENENLELQNAAAQAEEKPVVPESQKADTPDKDKKKDKAPAKKEKKETIFRRLARLFREVKSELKKVVWPTRSQTINNTLVVIVCVILVGVCIWVFDWVANLLIDALLSLFGG